MKPQGAANRAEADSVQLSLMEMNLLMALETDRLLTDSVRASGEAYVLDPRNFWYLRTVTTEGDEVSNGMRVEYSATVRDLATGSLVEERTEEVEVGKGETLTAIDCCLSNMREGETCRLIAPYYDAYGRDGNAYAEPLTNVTIVLTINAITKK
ncbi:MAG: FKBP-type peptidyl-prolyl cis-trans isomerase [Paludibacteraceae bacterium]|nr:FKBP-type peptidyl-prolyl cis-trans isomerase [Paludibacteraceae bacterium]